MHEGGKRLIIAPPGPLQKQGTKSLVWVVGLSEALAEAGLGMYGVARVIAAHAVQLKDHNPLQQGLVHESSILSSHQEAPLLQTHTVV